MLHLNNTITLATYKRIIEEIEFAHIACLESLLHESSASFEYRTKTKDAQAKVHGTMI